MYLNSEIITFLVRKLIALGIVERRSRGDKEGDQREEHEGVEREGEDEDGTRRSGDRGMRWG